MVEFGDEPRRDAGWVEGGVGLGGGWEAGDGDVDAAGDGAHVGGEGLDVCGGHFDLMMEDRSFDGVVGKEGN